MMEKVLWTFLYIFSVLSLAKSQLCGRAESVDISSGVRLENGSVLHLNNEYTSAEFYELKDSGAVKLFGCPCIRRTCLWKCCGDGEAIYGRPCNKTDLGPFNPPVFDGTKPLGFAEDRFFYMYTAMTDACESRYLVDSSNKDEDLYIQPNAELLEVSAFGSQSIHPTRYCVDMKVDEDLEPRLVAAVCNTEFEEEDSTLLFTAYAIGLMLSVLFLVATFLVYAFIPELQNLHGMCLMAYCAGLIVAYTLLAYLKLNPGEIGVAMTGCFLIAFIVYFSLQTSFFWLNVMCFDIWRTFSSHRGGSSNKNRDLKRFMLYSIYAYGVPVFLTVLTGIMQFSDGLPNGVIRPNIGQKRCWFDNWMSELSYIYGPILVLVMINVTLFIITANRIRSIRQETAILRNSESARSDTLKRDKQRYALYLKLFMVMGVNWTVELISFAVGGSNWYWILLDLSNVQLGFLIFFIFVWKKKVLNLIRKRGHPPLDHPLARVANFYGDSRLARDSAHTGRWATQSSSAVTEETRITSKAEDEAGIRLKDIN